MIPLPEVQQFVFDRVSRREPVEVPLAGALGLVLAVPVVATEAVPPFANSAMDGYAVRSVDTARATTDAPVTLTVVDELPAGRAPSVAVGPGQAIRIMTGAPTPEGADAIVMVEHSARDGDRSVLISRPARAGDHVRKVGGDVAAGHTVFDAGTVLGGAHLGVIASLGQATVVVRPRPRVGVLSTGDELVPVDSGPLAPGRIRDSNRPMLLGLVVLAGCEPVDLGWAPDTEDAIAAVVERGLATCDAMVSTGGVSVGDFDFMKAVLDRLGEMSWFQVAIKPSKPFAFGLCGARRVPVFGLPGNPVSSHVSFELFARPALRWMLGDDRPARPVVRAVAGSAMGRRSDGKLHLDRVHVECSATDGRFVARRSGEQVSNVLSAMALANGLALLPDGPGVAEGDDVMVMLLDLPEGLAGPLRYGSPLGIDNDAPHDDC